MATLGREQKHFPAQTCKNIGQAPEMYEDYLFRTIHIQNKKINVGTFSKEMFSESIKTYVD